mgnify:CR=1 FL=1
MTSTDFKARRLALWPSQAKAAADLGVSRATVTHWESGRHPVPGTIVRLLECIIARSKNDKT